MTNLRIVKPVVEDVFTTDQQAALDAIEVFLATDDKLDFLLEGGAGTGKTFLVARLLQRVKRNQLWVCAAFTHKATAVLRDKLDDAGVPWHVPYDDRRGRRFGILTGTTAQLLGIQPNFESEETNAHNLPFAKKMRGFLERECPNVVLVDEVSMISDEQFTLLRKLCREIGAKIIAVGDAAQLPPVKAVQIDFTSFAAGAKLTQVVRQGEESAIIRLAGAVRNGASLYGLDGVGVRFSTRLVDDFLDVVKAPGERAERDREVFIAYTNRRVDMVQERACLKVYGHGMDVCEPGEVVLAGTSIGTEVSRHDELVVVEFQPDHRDPDTHGIPVWLKSKKSGEVIESTYLTPSEYADPKHPWNVELQQRLEFAQSFPKQISDSEGMMQRGEAWRAFYKWKESVILFSHPFAITSHKSQGSTYHTVFADAEELKRYSQNALYVAVTRPRDTLVVPPFPKPGLNPFLPPDHPSQPQQ